MQFLDWCKVDGAERVIVNVQRTSETVVLSVGNHREPPLFETRASRYPLASREVRQPAAGTGSEE